MAKVLFEKVAEKQAGDAMAVATVISRYRGNTEAIVSCETFEGTAEFVSDNLKKIVRKKAADKKVVITVISGRSVVTRIYDASL